MGFPASEPDERGVSGIPVTTGVSYTTLPPGVDPATKSAVAASPLRLDFVLDAAFESVLADGKKAMAAQIADNIVTCLDFPDFGAKSISAKCKGISTDSFVQMCLALAYTRDRDGELPVTYETASTRSFFHGRTETIRPQSMPWKTFLEGFDATKQGAAGAKSEREMADLVRAAGNAHRNYLRKCMAGNGVDRHLMALRILAAEQGWEPHALFADKAYPKSTQFTLSTSQMPWASQSWPGFGAYDAAAYAVCYRFTHCDTIFATVSSRGEATGQGKDAKRFAEVIKGAFRDVMGVLERNPPPPKADKAKLKAKL